MGIYQRDNINYQSMIDNMIRNRNEGSRIRSDNLRNQGDIWANVVNNLGQIGAQTAQYYQTRDDQLADAKAAYDQKVAERIAQQKFQDEQRAAQEAFQKEQQARQFAHAEELAKAQRDEQAKYNQNEIMNKYQLALTDYELASKQVDLSKPETVARLKRSAQIVNNYASQLNMDPVALEANNDSEAVQILKNKKAMDAMLKINQRNWTDDMRNQYQSLLSTIPYDDEEYTKFNIDLTNKGPTREDIDSATANAINTAIKSGNRDKLPAGYSVRSFDGVQYVAKKNASGKWTKVKKWGK